LKPIALNASAIPYGRVLLGDTTEQIARKVRGHANRGYQDGALQMSRANAASIAKTAVGHLAATARTALLMPMTT
jgi:hypothetical protein